MLSPQNISAEMPRSIWDYRPENDDSCFTGACRALCGVEENLSQWAEEQINSWDGVWAGHQALLQKIMGKGKFQGTERRGHFHIPAAQTNGFNEMKRKRAQTGL